MALQSGRLEPLAEQVGEHIDGTTHSVFYNALNELTTMSSGLPPATYEWDSVNRLVAVVQGNKRTEFSYDGPDRLVRIVEKAHDSITNDKRMIWCENELCEERDSSGGNVFKQYFEQGMKIVGGPSVGDYYYTRDHLRSVVR